MSKGGFRSPLWLAVMRVLFAWISVRFFSQLLKRRTCLLPSFSLLERCHTEPGSWCAVPFAGDVSDCTSFLCFISDACMILWDSTLESLGVKMSFPRMFLDAVAMQPLGLVEEFWWPALCQSVLRSKKKIGPFVSFLGCNLTIFIGSTSEDLVFDLVLCFRSSLPGTVVFVALPPK